MAIYHLHASIGKRQTGQSAKAKAAYIQREGRYARDRSDLLYAASGHMPAWVESQPTRYWEAADLYERANGKLFYQVEFALPIELNPQQQIDLVRAFTEHLTQPPTDATGPLPYTLAIHTGNGLNPHCHLLISERANDGVARNATQWFKRANPHSPERGGAAKTRTLQPKEWLLQARQAWEHQANQALEIAGYSVRIDRRTLEAQGIHRVPQLHLGLPVLYMEQRGLRTDRGDQILHIERLNSPVLELTHRETPIHERDRALTPEPQCGQLGRRARTLSAELGVAGRRRPRRLERNSEPSSDSGYYLEPAPDRDRRLLDTNRPDRRAGRAATSERDRVGPLVNRRSELADLARGNNHRPDRRSGSAERIRALAEPLQHYRPRRAELAELRPAVPAATYQQAEADRQCDGLEQTQALDRTYLAARRQLRAMGAERFEVGLRDGKTGRMLVRTWTPEETLKAMLWLKQENAKGADIYIRPAGEQNQGLILLDDLTCGAVERLKRDQLAPVAVIETSPNNFQAWIRLSQSPLVPAVATTAARHLAQKYGSDPNSADWRHFGRLAGFTNRKPIHLDEHGRSPYVLAHECSGHVAEQGQHWTQQAREQVRQAELQQAQETRLEAARMASERVPGRNPVGEYQRQLKRLLAHYGPSADLSRVDWMICKDMALKGYGPHDLVQALEQASPELPSRKLGHEYDYAERTIDRIMTLPEVQQQRRELVRERSRSLDRDRGLEL